MREATCSPERRYGRRARFARHQHVLLRPQVFEEAVVKRVDEGLGLVCALPAGEGALPLAPGFAHVSALTEAKVEALGKVRAAPKQAQQGEAGPGSARGRG